MIKLAYHYVNFDFGCYRSCDGAVKYKNECCVKLVGYMHFLLVIHV